MDKVKGNPVERTLAAMERMPTEGIAAIIQCTATLYTQQTGLSPPAPPPAERS